LDALERELDGLFRRAKLDIEFTKHFFDRVNDVRNVRQITVDELLRLFREVRQKHAAAIRQVRWEGVLRDKTTAINVPFALEPTKDGFDLVAKTVMRKRGFRSSDKPFVVATSEGREDPFARAKAAIAARRAFIAKHGERPLRIDSVRRRGRFVVLSVDPQARAWRLTWFDSRGPSGHSLFSSYADALRELPSDYPISSAVFESEPVHESVQRVRQYLDGQHQVVDVGQIGWFRVYSVQRLPQGFLDTNPRIEGFKRPIPLAEFVKLRASPEYLAVQDLLAHGAEDDKTRQVFVGATRALTKFGARRANEVALLTRIKNVNPITGGGVGGFAFRRENAIEVSRHAVSQSPEYAVNTVIHEWAHRQFFRLPRDARMFVSQWFQANVVRNPEITGSGGDTAVPKEVRTLMVSGAWNAFRTAWAKVRKIAPDDWMDVYRATKIIKTAGGRPDIDRLGTYAVLRTHKNVVGRMEIGYRPDKSVPGLRKGDRVHVSYEPHAASGRQISIALDPNTAKRKGRQDSRQYVPKLDDVIGLVAIDIDRTATVAKADPSAIRDLLSDTGYEDPATYFGNGRLVDRALDEVPTAIQDVAKLNGVKPWRMAILGTTAFRAVADEFVAAAKKDNESFDPEKTFRASFWQHANWDYVPQESPDVSFALTRAEGQHLRQKAHELGVTPSDYAAANVDELWAVTIEYLARKRGNVSVGLRNLVRAVFQGQTPKGSPREKGPRGGDPKRKFPSLGVSDSLKRSVRRCLRDLDEATFRELSRAVPAQEHDLRAALVMLIRDGAVSKRGDRFHAR
jgi:hypothetical protein